MIDSLRWFVQLISRPMWMALVPDIEALGKFILVSVSEIGSCSGGLSAYVYGSSLKSAE